MLETLTIDDFSGRIGETFSAVAADGRRLTLTLKSIEAIAAPAGAANTPFSLQFCERARDHVPQQTLAVEHPEMGAFDLFVVPLGPSRHGMCYEAIFT